MIKYKIRIEKMYPVLKLESTMYGVYVGIYVAGQGLY